MARFRTLPTFFSTSAAGLLGRSIPAPHGEVAGFREDPGVAIANCPIVEVASRRFQVGMPGCLRRKRNLDLPRDSVAPFQPQADARPDDAFRAVSANDMSGMKNLAFGRRESNHRLRIVDLRDANANANARPRAPGSIDEPEVEFRPLNHPDFGRRSICLRHLRKNGILAFPRVSKLRHSQIGEFIGHEAVEMLYQGRRNAPATRFVTRKRRGTVEKQDG